MSIIWIPREYPIAKNATDNSSSLTVLFPYTKAVNGTDDPDILRQVMCGFPVSNVSPAIRRQKRNEARAKMAKESRKRNRR